MSGVANSLEIRMFQPGWSMAISLGSTSENLLRGIDRMIATLATALPVRGVRQPPAISRAWASQRGLEILREQVDVAGGFPGSLRWQQRLNSTSLHLTDTWLIIGEGSPSGFTLPLDRIVGASMQRFGGLRPPGLLVWYQDGDMHGSFLLSFRSTARNRAGVLRAEHLLTHLTDLGVQPVDEETAYFVPSIHCAWDEVADLADDDVLFSGQAIASSAGPFGSVLDSSEIWITERSLIWCPEHGQGLNRLPLDAIIDCRNGFGDRISIGIEDACGGRYDLYFDFTSKEDRSNPAARVKHLLAAVGIPTGTAVTPIAPWRSGGTRRPSDI